MTTIPINSSYQIVNISIMGYNYDLTTDVFLCANGSIFPLLSSVDNYTTLNRVSSICPAFTGYPLTTYNVLDKNRINVTIDSSVFINTEPAPTLIDVVVVGAAGYTKLSDKQYILSFDPT